MLPHDALTQRIDRPRSPEPVRIAVILIPAAILLDLLTGLIGGFTLLAVDVANDAGARIVVASAYTTAVLSIAFGHTVIWLIARIAAVLGIARARPWARVTAFAVEGLAIVLWAAVLFTGLEDGDGADIGGGPQDALHGFAVACMVASAAIIVLLSLPQARAWFKD